MSLKVKIGISILLLAFLASGAAGGFYFGKTRGRDAARKEYKAMLDLAFPPPPKEIKSLSGVFKKAIGGTIIIEIDDPDDYLPHLDQSARKKETRAANVMVNTEYTFTDYTKLDASGNPTVSKIKISDIKAGDVVTVKSDENIRDAKRFDVKRLEVVKY